MKSGIKLGAGLVIGVLAVLAACGVISICGLGTVVMSGIVAAPRLTLTPSTVGVIPAARIQTPNATTTQLPVIPSAQTPSATSAQTPNPKDLGQSVVYQNISTTIIAYEFSSSYKPTSGADVQPPAGAKFFWLHVTSTNSGDVQLVLPRPDSFTVLYRGTEVTQTYNSERPGYRFYRGGSVFPTVGDEGWVLFVLPNGASVNDLVVRANLGSYPGVLYFWRLGPP